MAATTTILSLAGQATADILVADSFCVHKMGRVPGASSLVLVSALLYRSRRRFCRRCRNIPPPPIDNSCSSGVGGGGRRLFWRMLHTTTTASRFVPLLRPTQFRSDDRDCYGSSRSSRKSWNRPTDNIGGSLLLKRYRLQRFLPLLPLLQF